MKPRRSLSAATLPSGSIIEENRTLRAKVVQLETELHRTRDLVHQERLRADAQASSARAYWSSTMAVGRSRPHHRSR